MKIPEKKKEYLDKEIFVLVNLIEVTPHSPFTKMEYVSFDGKTVIDLPLTDGSTDISETSGGETSANKRCIGNECRGFNNENYKLFLKFVDAIFKENSINSVVSKNFIEKITFDFIIDTHLHNFAAQSFSSFLIDSLISAVKEIEIFCSIQHLEIHAPFNIGNVKFKQISKEVFNAFENIKKKEEADLLREKYEHRFFASYIVTAELEKAKTIAFEQCCFAMDILKICYETVDFPTEKLSFDLDARATEKYYGEIVSTEINDLTSLRTHTSILPKQHELHYLIWERMQKRHLQIYSTFFSSLSDEKTEVQKLIIRSIQKFATALSTTNLNQRVADLFTVFESLLLIDQDTPIIESVTKYTSKLVYKNAEDRKHLISIMKKMYGVRSKFMHHAINEKIDLDELSLLQRALSALLANLTVKSKKHLVKNTILQEIDDAILRAY